MLLLILYIAFPGRNLDHNHHINCMFEKIGENALLQVGR